MESCPVEAIGDDGDEPQRVTPEIPAGRIVASSAGYAVDRRFKNPRCAGPPVANSAASELQHLS
jgi:hypothetical protein